MGRHRFDHRAHLVDHAQARAHSRYGAGASAKDFEDLRAQIVQGKAKLIEEQVLKGVYEVVFHGQPARVVYHRVKRKIITFLPMPMTREWMAHQQHTRGSVFRNSVPEPILLDTDYWPKKESN